ncbi:MAG: biotin synthase BioB [bacterium]
MSKSMRGRVITAGQALAILKAPPDDLPRIMADATALRRKHFGRTLHLCSIVNARSGACSEDCAFCAQSIHHKSKCEVFGLCSGDKLVKAYSEASKLPVSRFGVVTSGPAQGPSAVKRIIAAIAKSRKTHVQWCASLGSIGNAELLALKKAGVRRFHHNIETAGSFFPRVCSTHTFDERIATIRAVKAVGMQVCSGGILGMGESMEQRVEMALTLAAEDVEAIPLNFLIPVPGTRLGHLKAMKPLDILKTIAMFRMTNPTAEIKVCAGRIHLRQLQSMIFYAGATGMMIGRLLTVAGCDVDQDLQMLKDLEL